MNKQIIELLEVGALNKKKADSLLGQIIANICFSLLDDVSKFIYKERSIKQAEYNSFCDGIFISIEKSIKNAHKAKTFDEFYTKVTYPIFEVNVIINNLATKYEFIQNNKELPQLLEDFKKEGTKIYNRFYKKVRQNRKVKTNGNK